MSSVAEKLRTAREESQLSIDDVAETTKLKPQYIRALEEGNFDVFSAPLYIRGSVRTIAKQLKLDEAKLIEELDNELAQTRKFREPPPLNGQRNGFVDFLLFHISRVQWRYVLPVLVLIVIAIGGVIAFQLWRSQESETPLDNLGPGIYNQGGSDQEDTLDVPSTPPAND